MRVVRLLALAGWLALVPTPGPAAIPGWLTTPPPRDVRLDPTGERIAWRQGRAVAVAPVAAPDERTLLRLAGPVVAVTWAGADAVVAVVLGRRDEHLVLVPLERPADRRSLAVAPRAAQRRLRILRADRRSVLFTSDRRSPFAPDLLRADLAGQGVETLARNPGRVFRWILDEASQPAVAQAWEPAGAGVRYLWLARTGSGFHAVRHFDLRGPLEELLRVGDRGWLLARQGDDGASLAWFEPFSRRLAPVWSGRPGRVTGVVDALPGPTPGLIAVEAARPELLAGDPAWVRRLAALRERWPTAAVRLVDRVAGDARLLWRLDSDRHPSRWVLQEGDGSVRTLVSDDAGSGPVFARAELAFEARDGLVLTGYVTRPAGRAPAPAVVLVHGGPWARDGWRYDREARFLAGLGYLVLQVNFRGSSGLGPGHLRAGRREWGRAMQDDLEDVLAHAVAAGWARPGAACLMGASYGGYAALAGVLRAGSPFACAVSRAPVTDLAAQLAAIRASGNRRGYLEWRDMVGAPALLTARSPIAAQHLARPVLLGYGTADRVVAPAQARAFAERFPERVRSVPLAGAGHVLHDPAARRIWYGAVAAFLADVLGPGD